MSTSVPELIRWHSQFRHLRPWTDVATRGLSDESRARVLEEITAHFESAVEAGVERGLGEQEAARRAVEDLGSAHRARRAFRRTYLTRLQARSLHHLVETPLRGVLVHGVGILGLIAQMIFDPSDDTTARVIRFACLGVFVATGLARAAAVPHLFRRGRRRAAVVLGGVADFLFWSSFLVSGNHTTYRELWLVPFFFVLIAAAYLPIALKVERNGRRTTG